MKLLFNHNTKAIVMKLGDKYYDMRNGRLCDKPVRYSPLKPFGRENKTKWESCCHAYIESLYKLGGQPIEYGYQFDFGEIKIYLIFDTRNRYQISGKLPLYFLKSFNQLIKTL